MTRAEPSRPLWFLLLALALAGCAADPATSVAIAPTTVENLVARLPDSIGSFRRGGVTMLSDGAAGGEPSGQELAYATASREIAGYVQVLRSAAPVSLEMADAELARFVSDTTSGSPMHRRLRQRALVALPAGQPMLRCAELEGSFGRHAVESLACVGVFGGQLVRLRVSHIRREGRMAEVRGFAELVAAALR